MSMWRGSWPHIKCTVKQYFWWATTSVCEWAVSPAWPAIRVRKLPPTFRKGGEGIRTGNFKKKLPPTFRKRLRGDLNWELFIFGKISYTRLLAAASEKVKNNCRQLFEKGGEWIWTGNISFFQKINYPRQETFCFLLNQFCWVKLFQVERWKIQKELDCRQLFEKNVARGFEPGTQGASWR